MINSYTIAALLQDIASRYPTSEAILELNGTHTYGQLWEDVQKFAGGLEILGVEPGDTVGIWLPTNYKWLVAFFASTCLGAQVIGLNLRYKRIELEDFCRRAHIRTLIYSEHLEKVGICAILDSLAFDGMTAITNYICADRRPERKSFHKKSIILFDSLLDCGSKSSFTNTADANTPAVIFTSSGSTALPKLIQHRQLAITAHAIAIGKAFGYIHGEATVMSLVPAYGVFGMTVIMAALAAGCRTVLVDSFEAKKSADLVERYGVTHAVGSGQMFKRLFEVTDSWIKISSLREGAFANFGVDASALVDLAWAHGIKLFQTYGASEMWGLMSYPAAGTGTERWKVSGGQLTSDQIHFQIRDIESGECIDDDRVGQLEFSGPNIFLGYIGQPEKSAAVLTTDGFYRTGDLGAREGERCFSYLGRSDDALRLGGYLVQPREIESYIETFENIELAQVVTVTIDGHTRPVAFIKVKPQFELTEQKMIEKCKAAMAIYKVPINIWKIAEMPIKEGSNGVKVYKQGLRQLALARLGIESRSRHT